jgi:hypothetical protein
MIAFERTNDYALVRMVMTHPKLYRHLADDLSPAREDYDPPQGEHVWYVLAYDETPGDGLRELLGLWMLYPQNGICWEIHTALLPTACAGRRSHCRIGSGSTPRAGGS